MSRKRKLPSFIEQSQSTIPQQPRPTYPRFTDRAIDLTSSSPSHIDQSRQASRGQRTSLLVTQSPLSSPHTLLPIPTTSVAAYSSSSFASSTRTATTTPVWRSFPFMILSTDVQIEVISYRSFAELKTLYCISQSVSQLMKQLPAVHLLHTSLSLSPTNFRHYSRQFTSMSSSSKITNMFTVNSMLCYPFAYEVLVADILNSTVFSNVTTLYIGRMSITLPHISIISAAVPNVRRLHIQTSTTSEQGWLSLVTKTFLPRPPLTALFVDLSASQQAAHLTQLQSLLISQAELTTLVLSLPLESPWSASSFISLPVLHPRLTELQVKAATINDNDIVHLIQSRSGWFSQLKHLSLCNTNIVNMYTLIQHATSLVTLNLSYNHNIRWITANTKQDILIDDNYSAKKKQKKNIKNNQSEDEQERPLFISSITSLNLSHTTIDIESLPSIGHHLPQLTEVQLNHHQSLSTRAIKHLTDSSLFPCISRLSLQDCIRLTDHSFLSLTSGSTKLTRSSQHSSSYGHIREISLSISTTTSLRKLTDATLRNISQTYQQSLQILRMNGQSLMTLNGIAHIIRRCIHLQTLSIIGIQFEYDHYQVIGIDALIKVLNLSHLTLQMIRCGFNDLLPVDRIKRNQLIRSDDIGRTNRQCWHQDILRRVQECRPLLSLELV